MRDPRHPPRKHRGERKSDQIGKPDEAGVAMQGAIDRREKPPEGNVK